MYLSFLNVVFDGRFRVPVWKPEGNAPAVVISSWYHILSGAIEEITGFSDELQNEVKRILEMSR